MDPSDLHKKEGLYKKEDLDLKSDPNLKSDQNKWQWERHALQSLTMLSHRNGQIEPYLKGVVQGVSQLIEVDWSLVTLCQDGLERILSSSLELEDEDPVYSLHGTVTQTVFETGRTLQVEDTHGCPDYGVAPDGYRSYLGVPLRTTFGTVIGTICSFHRQPRQYSPEEVLIAELFAERAATVIDNHQLYQRLHHLNHHLEQEVEQRTQELTEAQQKLMEQERFAAIGKFASMIVHEIRNPLATVSLSVQHLRKLPLPELSHERLELADKALGRLDRLLQEILVYTKPTPLNLERIELNAYIGDLQNSLQLMPAAHHCQIRVDPAPFAVWIMADPDKLEQIVVNLVRNGCEAISDSGTVTCRIRQQEKNALLGIHNDGPPIPADILPRLTELFFTTKPSGNGLGLAIVKRLVEAHRGQLRIHSAPGQGTTVSVELPLHISLTAPSL